MDESIVGVDHNEVGGACCQQTYNDSWQDDGLEILDDGKFGKLSFQDGDSDKMGTSTCADHGIEDERLRTSVSEQYPGNGQTK